MGTRVVVGTQKGAMVFRSDESRAHWERSALLLKGWLVTAFARDASGRTYAGVTHDVWGATVMVSEDLENWTQLENAPRYPADAKGNADHNRIIGAMDPMEQFSPGGRLAVAARPGTRTQAQKPARFSYPLGAVTLPTRRVKEMHDALPAVRLDRCDISCQRGTHERFTRPG